MSSLRNWAARSVITAVLLFSPALAFLMVIAAEIVIDLVMDAGATAVCAIAAGAIGWVLFRKTSRRPKVVAPSGSEEVCDEPAIAAPSM